MHPSKDSLEHLQKRVREATGPDREMDWEILETLLPRTRTDLLFYGTPFTSDPEGLGACVALLREVLPGWTWKVGTCCVSDDAWVAPDWNCPTHGARLREQYGEPEYGSIFDQGVDIDRRPAGNVCLALLDAIISAKLSLSKEKEALSQIGEG